MQFEIATHRTLITPSSAPVPGMFLPTTLLVPKFNELWFALFVLFPGVKKDLRHLKI